MTDKRIKLPVGQSDFGKVLEGQFDFVDKSLLIPKVIEGPEVLLLTRPRRFGKTLNMSMLRYFFAPEVFGYPTKGLFDRLRLAQIDRATIDQHQGKYPVIFMTFKDIKEESFDLAYKKISEMLAALYDEFSYLQESSALSEYQKNFFKSILKKKANQAQLENSLKVLSECLFRHCGVKPVILIDEYDTPIQSSYLQRYYNKAIPFFRNFFSSALKDNPYLFKAVLTGILRVARESLFSGLNNLKVYSVLHAQFSEFFGFTEEEVNQLLNKANLQEKASEVKHWYNGYQVGNTVLYNPWSIVNCIQDDGVLKPFWVNTSDNELIKDLLLKSSTHFKEKFEVLLQGMDVERLVDENFVFADLQKNTDAAIWSLLLMTGYLTVKKYEETNRGSLCQLALPNQEIRNLYQTIIEHWFANGYGLEWYATFLQHLLQGEMEEFKQGLQRIMDHTVSVYDVGSEPESFYHGLMIGLTASIGGMQGYEIRSNRESGYGRYDYLILARDPKKLSIVFEFKRVDTSAGKKDSEQIKNILDKKAREALRQIEKQTYFVEVQQRGLTNILKIGLAFCGKRFGIAYENGRGTVDLA